MHLRRHRLAKPWAVLWLLILAGCSRGEPPTSSDDSSRQEASPPAAPVFVPVDLQSLGNRPVGVSEWLPGRRNFQGVDYLLGSQVMQVGSQRAPNFPRVIEGIPIGKTCQAIHFLQATLSGGYPQPGHPKHEADGVEVGRYIIHYTDGTQVIQPIVYGEQLRDWWDWDKNNPATQSNVVWTGENERSRKYQRRTRLYWAVWENPHPEKSLATLDFVSAGAKAAPFCAAMTLEVAP